MPLARKRVIYDSDGETPYMIRYHLFFREKSEHLEDNVDFHLMHIYIRLYCLMNLFYMITLGAGVHLLLVGVIMNIHQMVHSGGLQAP